MFLSKIDDQLEAFEEQYEANTKQFQIHKPAITPKKMHSKTDKKTSKKQPCRSSQIQEQLKEIGDECIKIRDQIFMKTKEAFCDQIIDTINNFFSEESRLQYKSYEHVVNPEKRSKFKLIIPIQVSQAQEQDSINFLQAFRNKVVDFQSQESSYSQSSTFQCKSDVFNFYHHVNIVDLMKTQYSFKDVLLYSYFLHKKVNSFSDVFIVLSSLQRQFTLDKRFLIQKAIEDANMIIIVPTRHKLRSYISPDKNLSFIPIEFVNSQKLIKEYLVSCFSSPILKPYLPQEILNIVEQFENFPISYYQGCRRLNYCIRSLHYELYRRKIKPAQAPIDDLLYILQKAITKGFGFIKFAINREQLRYSILQSVVDPKKDFKAIEDIFNSLSTFYNSTDMTDYNQEDICEQIFDNILKRLKSDDKLKKFCKYFQTQNTTPKKKRGKIKLQTPKKSKKSLGKLETSKSKAKSFQSTNQKSFHSPSKIGNSSKLLASLQGKIKNLIISNTKPYQAISNAISWEDIKYEETIKPQIFQKMYKVFYRRPQFQNILIFLQNQFSISLNGLLSTIDKNLMQDDDELKYGQIMFILKQLALYGIIQYKFHRMNPQVTLSYFQRGHYQKKMTVNH